MQTKSRDGRFVISAPNPLEMEEADVFFKSVVGRAANLLDLAHAIFFDCFEEDGIGLKLKAKHLKCHLTAGDKKYTFTISRYPNVEGILKDLCTQFTL